MKSNWILLAVAIVLLALVGAGFAKFGPSFSDEGSLQGALRLSQVVLIGLALVVGLMAFLAMVSAALGLANPGQALGLPEGSVRALIAFSLLLIFVCIAAFLYSTVDAAQLKGAFKEIPETALNDLKANYAVATETVGTKDGATVYSGQYASKRSREADDFAKLIFTTLATVFVSVVSFYFGSSATSAGVGAGLSAAGRASGTAPDGSPAGPGPGGSPSIASLEKAALDARAAATRAAKAAKDAADIATTVTPDKKDQATAHAAALQEDATAANRVADQAEKDLAAAKAQPAPKSSATDIRVVPPR